jgi:hypothetical protein
MFLTLLCVGCVTEEKVSEQSSTSTSTTTQTETQVVFNVIDTNDLPREGYSIMMFEEPPSENAPLPPIIMDVLSNTQGQATFLLDDYLGGSDTKTVFFEAFVKSGNDLIWKSVIHPELTIQKGTKRTTTILVRP